MDTCTKCGAELGVGRFCLNCGHPKGAPLLEATTRTARVPLERHEAAAEAARRLQGPPAPPSGPLPDRLVEDAPRARPETDDDWLLGDGDDDDGPRLHWAAWVLGALALVIAVMLALSFLGEDDPAAIEEPERAAPAAPEDGRSDPTGSGDRGGKDGEKDEDGGRAPGGPAVDVARDATLAVPATAPPTTDLDGAVVPYDARRMVDGDPATAWRMAGDGTGSTITFTLAEPAVVERVGLVNGYAKLVAGVDWYPNNRRILAVRWSFDDGTAVGQTLIEAPRVQWLAIEPVRTRKVTLTLASVSPPGAGELGRDYTAISSVVIRGRPVG